MDAQGITGPNRKLVMWYKVKELKSKGLNCVQVAHELGIHRQTVMKYDKMTLEEFQSSQSYEREFKFNLRIMEDEALADETLHLIKPRHKRCDLRDQADIEVFLHLNRTYKPRRNSPTLCSN